MGITMIIVMAAMVATMAVTTVMRPHHQAEQSHGMMPGCGMTHEMVQPSAGNYPIDYCIVSHKKLTDPVVTTTYNGREVRFCCSTCLTEFERDPGKYTSALEDAYRNADSLKSVPSAGQPESQHKDHSH